MLIKQFFIGVVLALLNSVAFAEQAMEWHTLGNTKVDGVSGITGIDTEHFLVVHDRKKVKEPRLGLVTWKKGEKPVLTKLNWCAYGDYPIDLEAITRVPSYPKEFLLLESAGKVTRIKLDDANACEVVTWFNVPTATSASNMEGLALHCFAKDSCVLAWAERGDGKNPAKFFWAGFDIAENELEMSQSQPFEFSAPFPTLEHRSITDIAIDDSGKVWVSASADGGDTGPFQSAIYNIGMFSQADKRINWQAATQIQPFAVYENENVKIEGLFFSADDLVIGTEDEELGGKIAAKPFK